MTTAAAHLNNIQEELLLYSLCNGLFLPQSKSSQRLGGWVWAGVVGYGQGGGWGTTSQFLPLPKSSCFAVMIICSSYLSYHM